MDCLKIKRAMEKNEQNIRIKIMARLIEKYPDLNPKIAEISGKRFTYELERHKNYTYFIAEYKIDPSGELKVDWDNAEQTMF
jgi:hypothetical protein